MWLGGWKNSVKPYYHSDGTGWLGCEWEFPPVRNRLQRCHSVMFRKQGSGVFVRAFRYMHLFLYTLRARNVWNYTLLKLNMEPDVYTLLKLTTEPDVIAPKWKRQFKISSEPKLHLWVPFVSFWRCTFSFWEGCFKTPLRVFIGHKAFSGRNHGELFRKLWNLCKQPASNVKHCINRNRINIVIFHLDEPHLDGWKWIWNSDIMIYHVNGWFLR